MDYAMMMRWIGRAAGTVAGLAAGHAFAQGEPTDLPIVGVPVPGGVNYQPAVTELAHDMHWLSHFVHAIMIAIVLFVMVLLLIVVVRYNNRRNPAAARFTHNTPIEIAWTLVPVLILIVIGSLSLPILFKQLEVPESDLTIKATGNQWFWTYEYPDYAMTFDALMLRPEELAEHGYSEDLYLLATDNSVVVPVGAVVRLQVTGSDVIHSWAMPSFGVKMDGVPGRLAETWFAAEREGVYFGQCSELCGKDHSYMPITVKVVSQERYDEWLDWAVAEYGGEMPTAEPAPGAAAAAETAPADEAAPAAGGAAEEEPAAEEAGAGEPAGSVEEQPAADQATAPEPPGIAEEQPAADESATGEAEAEAPAEEPAEPAQ
jgi:cytochrome c oxidase subunit II